MLLGLPSKIVTLLDALKERQGLRNRRQALLQLIERRRQPPSTRPEYAMGLTASVWRTLRPPI